MGIIRNTASALMRGRVGNTTFYVQGSRQIARVSQNGSNYGETARRTLAMQTRRVKWANLVNFYKVSRSWMKYAFETKSSKQSDYNKFMSVNIGLARVALTKEEAALGGCVVDAYNVSQGSIRAIAINQVGAQWRSDIALGSLTISESTTIAEFTAAVKENNSGITDGYQLSFVSYQQMVDANNIPQLICTPYEVTLDSTSEAKLRDFLPSFCTQVLNGYLATSMNISVGAFAYVWSVTINGRTSVSSQSLITNNGELLQEYTSPVQQTKAIASYGLDTDAFLMSGSEAQESAAPTFYIASVRDADGEYITQGEVLGRISSFSEDSMQINMSTEVEASQIIVSMIGYDGTTVSAVSASLASDKKLITAEMPRAQNVTYIKTIIVSLNGVIYRINFADGE